MIALKNINWTNFFISIGFSFLFVYVIPWDDLKDFNDIANYLDRIVYLNDGGSERVYTGISIISSEVLWKYLLIYMSSLDVFVDDYRSILLLISFVSLFIYSQFSLKRVNPILFVLLVFNPLFMHLIIEQVRIALAFSLLLFVFDYREVKWVYILIPISVLIHTVVLLLIGIYFLLNFIIKRFNKNNVYKLALITSFLFGLFLKYGIVYILGYLGDRRVIYNLNSSTLLFSTIWIIYGFLLVLYCKKNNTELMRIASYSIFITGLFFTFSLLGFPGQRLIAIFLPLIIISLNGIRNYHLKSISFFVFGLYNLVSWFYWFKLFDSL